MGLSGRLHAALSERRTVAIADCVHFCAYRYGRNETNPYEEYARKLHAGYELAQVRREFVAFLQRYRPLDLGQALGVRLSRSYPLWFLPWRTSRNAIRNPGWVSSPEAVVDAMTHFCAAGIPQKMLDREYAHHEDAVSAMRSVGYLPDRFDYITARELRGERSAYLVTDGNHRLSALSTMGQTTVAIRLLRGTTIHRDRVDRWPLVRAGLMTQKDAVRVFDAYIHGNQNPLQLDESAGIV